MPLRTDLAEGQERTTPMTNLYRDLLLIVPAAFAEGFLLWALWNFLKSSRRRSTSDAQRAVSSVRKMRQSIRRWHNPPVVANAKLARIDENRTAVRRPLSTAH
ncbi:MAG: hypothetical protein ABR991_07205 [Terracidiphilus sp.]